MDAEESSQLKLKVIKQMVDGFVIRIPSKHRYYDADLASDCWEFIKICPGGDCRL